MFFAGFALICLTCLLCNWSLLPTTGVSAESSSCPFPGYLARLIGKDTEICCKDYTEPCWSEYYYGGERCNYDRGDCTSILQGSFWGKFSLPTGQKIEERDICCVPSVSFEADEAQNSNLDTTVVSDASAILMTPKSILLLAIVLVLWGSTVAALDLPLFG